jgi:hypothetical protein
MVGTLPLYEILCLIDMLPQKYLGSSADSRCHCDDLVDDILDKRAEFPLLAIYEIREKTNDNRSNDSFSDLIQIRELSIT